MPFHKGQLLNFVGAVRRFQMFGNMECKFVVLMFFGPAKPDVFRDGLIFDV